MKKKKGKVKRGTKKKVVRRRAKVSTRRKRSGVRRPRARILRAKQEVATARKAKAPEVWEEFELTATTKGWTPRRH